MRGISDGIALGLSEGTTLGPSNGTSLGMYDGILLGIWRCVTKLQCATIWQSLAVLLEPKAGFSLIVVAGDWGSGGDSLLPGGSFVNFESNSAGSLFKAGIRAVISATFFPLLSSSQIDVEISSSCSLLHNEF